MTCQLILETNIDDYIRAEYYMYILIGYYFTKLIKLYISNNEQYDFKFYLILGWYIHDNLCLNINCNK